MEPSALTQPPTTGEVPEELNLILNKCDSLKELDISNYDWKCCVRAQSIWKGINRETQQFYGINIIFMDESNSKIHAFANTKICNKYEDKLVEGEIYVLRNFKVKQYLGDETSRPVRNDKHIYFTQYTEVEKCSEPILQIEPYAFDFSALEEIEKIVNDNRFLIDIVGIVINHRPLSKTIKDGKEKLRLRFDLTNRRDVVRVSLFNDFAQRCEEVLIQSAMSDQVLAIASSKVGKFNEKTYVSNYPATRFYLNPKHYCVKQVKESPEEEEEIPVMNIKQITELTADFIEKVVCCEVVMKKVDEKAGWFFNKCTRCVVELIKEGKHFICPDCKRIIPYPDRRFRLFTICGDQTASIVLIMHDADVRKLTGKAVLDFIGDNDDDVDNLPLPDVLRDLKNKTYTVNIAISEDNILNRSTVYTVTDVFNGKELTGNHSPSKDTLIHSNQLSIIQENLGPEQLSETPQTAKSSNKIKPRDPTPIAFEEAGTSPPPGFKKM